MRRCLLIFVVLSTATGCRRDEITHFRVRKTSEPTLARTAAPARSEVPRPPAPDGVLEWTLPPGWTESSKAGTVSLYDFTSDGKKKSRLVAGLAVLGDSTWFVKMVGDAVPVGAARPDFIHLLESLRQ